MRTKPFRIFSLVMAVVLLVPMVATAQTPAERAPQPAQADPAAKQAPGRTASDGDQKTSAVTREPPAADAKKPTYEDVSAKLYPTLRERVQQAGLTVVEGEKAERPLGEPILVHVIVSADAVDDGGLMDQIRPYFVDGKLFVEPQSTKEVMDARLIAGVILPSDLIKVASFDAVKIIYPADIERAEYADYPADDPQDKAKPGPEEWAKLRENAAAMRGLDIPWSEAQVGDGGPDDTRDWFEVQAEGPHKAEAAWDRGYHGEGVTIAVIDDGVDFGHPDLQGTYQIYSGTDFWNPDEPSPYNGWPYAMDPFTMRAYFYERYFGSNYFSSESFGGSTYIDTSTTPPLTPCGVGMECFHYTPWIDYGVPGFQHTYVIDALMTKSGVVHVGTHPDESLRDYIWGEKVAVLVADPNVNGVYDTVYVDLDDDYDFRDEKPMTRADLANLALTYGNPVSFRDMTGDQIADLSGGLLYFIADGAHYPPAFEWLFLPDYFGVAAPGNGDLVAIHGPWDSGYSHGTQCASNAVSNAKIDGMLPSFRDLGGTGKPEAAVYGMAPGARLAAMNTAWNYSGRITYRDAYLLAAIGPDGIDQQGWHWWYGPEFEDTDTIVATSNSYGFSDEFNDGYDYTGQYVVQVQRIYGKYLQFLFSTGNGAPGYGTVAPPSPALGIAVGASTEYGATGWDTITDTDQIMFNDIAAFSNSGPGARGGAGVDVVAGGAYAAGSEELNYYSADMYGILNGNVSWDDWGGTSRSAPVALGIYALLAQAYRDAHGDWPTYDVGKALMMSSATDLNYDVFKQGAGSVNADIGTMVASGEYGVYMGSDSANWDPGDFQGEDYPAFAHLVYPGDTDSKTFTVVNDSDYDVTLDVDDGLLELIGTKEFAFNVTPAMKAQENEDNFYKGFNYFIPITAEPGNDPSWYVNNVTIPPETDLMVVREIYPFNEYDINGDYAYDARYYLVVYNWKDQDGDGKVWVDKNANGVVDFKDGPYLGPDGLKAAPELAWNDPVTELDRWEYGRFGYNRPVSNIYELTIRDPLERMFDGIFIGPRRLNTSRDNNITTHLKYRIEFYQKADVPWLETDVDELVVPAEGEASFDGTVNVPADMPAGVYEAALYLYDAGLVEDKCEYVGCADYSIVVPVVINVAADLEELLDGGTIGGYESYDYDADMMYNNGDVRGYFMWDWREESGDGRFFYVDLDNRPIYLPILEEDFEGTFPPEGWVRYETGDALQGWVQSTPSNPNAEYRLFTAHSGTHFAWHNDESLDEGDMAESWLVMPQFSVPDDGPTQLRFWQAAALTECCIEKHAVMVTTDPTGDPLYADYEEVYSYAEGPDKPPWEQVIVDLTDYAGEDVFVAFYYLGNELGTEWYVDDAGFYGPRPPYDPTAHVLVRDVWEDAAPHTDIDTIVLGPVPSPLADSDAGVWGMSLDDPDYFGPYPLNIVGRSVDDRAGRSVWRFNTTSGANEEWVSFKFPDPEVFPDGGLTEIFQHNVLFEGDKFAAVFTKTLGLLTEDVHVIDIDTYLDEGVASEITLQSTMDLPGLVVDAYLGALDHTSLKNEPIGFTGPGTLEWYRIFQVSNGISIETWTSSANISDIDLLLYYWNGSTWVQRASSAGADANEYIYLPNPEDGNWLVAIDNYSGPVGTFNLDLLVASKAPGLTVLGVPAGPVPANTPVVLTVLFDYPMDEGMTYPGAVVIGVPQAPQLKEIPVYITKLPPAGAVVKTVDEEITFPNHYLRYAVDLYNLDGEGQVWEFEDPIPADTEFIEVATTLYGACPMAELWSEDFDLGVSAAWTVVDNTGNGEWMTSSDWGDGNYTGGSGEAATVDSDEAGSVDIDSELWTPPFDLPAGSSVMVRYLANYQNLANEDYLDLDISTDGGATWTTLLSWNEDHGALYGLPGEQVSVDLSAYAGMDDLILRWHYYDANYAWYAQIDDVAVGYEQCPEATYDPVKDAVVYTGLLPAAGLVADPEGFEMGLVPPLGWDQVQNNANQTWVVETYDPHSGVYYADCSYDEALNLQDEWLVSPLLEGLAGGEPVSLWSYGSVYWAVTPYDNYDINVWLVVGAPGGGDDLLLGNVDEDWPASWTWTQSTFDLPATLPAGDLYVGVQYTGVDGAEGAVDDIDLPGEQAGLAAPSARFDIMVYVDSMLAAGTEIVNEATLETTHKMPKPLGEQVETLVASALSVIGSGPSFTTSYKEAPETALKGETLRYDVHVINTGNEHVYVDLTDPIPEGTTLVDWESDWVGPYWFDYNDDDDQMEAYFPIGPGDEEVFTFWVEVDDDIALWDSIIQNVATIEWDEDSMDLVAGTRIVPEGRAWLPLVVR